MPPSALLTNIPRLVSAYYTGLPDATVAAQQVAFGTSGHRGSSLLKSFNEWHVLAIAQAVCDYRAQQGIDGPLFLGIDTHALSEPAYASTLEVLAANGVEVMIATNDEYTPTPVVSHAILAYNVGRSSGLADGDNHFRHRTTRPITAASNTTSAARWSRRHRRDVVDAVARQRIYQEQYAGRQTHSV